MKTMKFYGNKRKAERNDELMKKHAEGWGLKRLGKLYNISHITVRGIVINERKRLEKSTNEKT